MFKSIFRSTMILFISTLVLVNCEISDEQKLYNVSFDSNGGSAVDNVTVADGGLLKAPAVPTKTGYSFDGWYKEAVFTTAWDFDNDTVTGDITLYGKWTTALYTVTFDSNGGTEITAVTAAHNSTITTPAAPTKTGEVFISWYKDAELNSAWDFTADTVTQDITLYAKWGYSVTFDSNEGSAVSSLTKLNGDKITKPDTPTRTYFRFDGWFKENTFNNAWDFDTDTVTQELTLYAKWTEYSVGNIGPTGGYIFYDDESDGVDNFSEWRFLETAPSDLPETKHWAYLTIGESAIVPGADGTAIGTGKQNTLDIIAAVANTINAAYACDNYTIEVNAITYDDWFLPSDDELKAIYSNLIRNNLGEFKNDVDSLYWTSTESQVNLDFEKEYALALHPNSGGGTHDCGKEGKLYVRPIRAF